MIAENSDSEALIARNANSLQCGVVHAFARSKHLHTVNTIVVEIATALDHHVCERKCHMDNRVIDDYRLEAEIQDENSTLPVRFIATNTDDKSTAEAWLTMDRATALYVLVYGELGAAQFQLLREHGYHELTSQEGRKSYCIVRSEQLIPFGFSPDDLRPWRLEKAS